MKSVKSASVSHQRVFLRADLDVPLENGKVRDDSRIVDALKTVEFLVSRGAKVIIGAHLDRPGGKRVPELSLGPVGEVLGRFLEVPGGDLEDQISPLSGAKDLISKASDCTGKKVSQMVGELEIGGVLLLENLRFHPEEEANDPDFAARLASLADLYVNDCFAASHRQHASLVALAELLPAYAGLDLEEEVVNLSLILKDPKRPLVFILGGAKSETKLPLVGKFLKLADTVLIGGKLAYEVDPTAAQEAGELVLPAGELDGQDIDQVTCEEYARIIGQAGTVIWNGPMGVWEKEQYQRGTLAVAKAIAEASAFSIVGGGDTLAAVKAFGLQDRFGFLSSGGGAMLEFLAGNKLPGLEALESG